MKKILIVMSLVLCAGLAYGADPDNNSTYNQTATISVTADHSVATWTEIDSSIVLETDSCDVYWLAQGTAVLQPGQRLYIGFRDSPTGTRTNIKSFQVPHGSKGPMTIYWGNFYQDSLLSQTDKTDSIFLDAAVMGTGVNEKVVTTVINYTGTVINRD